MKLAIQGEASQEPLGGTLARLLHGIEREPLVAPAALILEGVTVPAFDSRERSVVKIRTADVFAQRDADGTGLLEARRLLEAFDDAETRMSSLPVTFDDPSTGGHSLRALDERTELTPRGPRRQIERTHARAPRFRYSARPMSETSSRSRPAKSAFDHATRNTLS